MKQKLFMMLAALMLLGTSAMAQSETLKGDVNADGVVDVADIAAVIAIMAKEAEGETKYYWYAGWTEPTAANIATIINEEYPSANGSTTMNPAGKTSTTLAGTVIDFGTNPIYDQEAINNKQKRTIYYVLPDGYGIYNPNMRMYVQDEPSVCEEINKGKIPGHRILKDLESPAYMVKVGIICELSKYNN